MSHVVPLVLSLVLVLNSWASASAECSSDEVLARCDVLPSTDDPLEVNQNISLLYVTRAVGLVPEGGFASLTKLMDLEMYSGITDIQPGAFDGLESLISLNLFNNSIERLEAGTFKGCDSLENLILGRNRITHIEPRAFENLVNLTYLDLSRNPNLKVLGDHVFSGLGKLTILQCVECGIHAIQPLAFDGASKLMHLNLRFNKLTELNGNEFEQLPHLQELILSSNNMTQIGIGTLVNKNKDLKTLRLKDNRLQCDVVKEIGLECTSRNITVHVITLDENSCEDLESTEETSQTVTVSSIVLE